MIAILPAVLAAIANACSSVLQRRAAKTAPLGDALRPALLFDVLRRPVWLGGIGCMIAAFVLQATALSPGALSLVQPLLALELPTVMLIISRLGGSGLGRPGWTAMLAMTAGLAALLAGAAPRAGNRTPGAALWLLAGLCCAAAVAALVLCALRLRGPVRAVLFGVATGIAFGLTAALMKATTDQANRGFTTIFTGWQLYAMAGCGVVALFLMQNALQSASLAAGQPALTISDPVASMALGVALFDEKLRLGAWLILEIAGVALIVLGSVRLTSSPIWRDQAAEAKHN